METIIQTGSFSERIITSIEPFSRFKSCKLRNCRQIILGAILRRIIIIYRLHGTIDHPRNALCQTSNLGLITGVFEKPEVS